MAEYKGIHGTKVENYTSDPDNPITGQVWYNETNQVLKFQYVNTNAAGSWSTGGSLNTARKETSGVGTQTAALVIGGAPLTGKTESYDGASFTEVGDLNNARNQNGSAGTQTSALTFGGEPTASNGGYTESWNGSAWTEVADLTTARRIMGSAGASNTNALAFGGFSTTSVANTES